MRSFRDHDLGALRLQHPDWNFQSPPTWVHDADGPISSLRSAKDLQGGTMKRVKWVEDLNIRIVRAQGIVGVGVTIRMFIFSFPGPAGKGKCQHWDPMSGRGPGRRWVDDERATPSDQRAVVGGVVQL